MPVGLGSIKFPVVGILDFPTSGKLWGLSASVPVPRAFPMAFALHLVAIAPSNCTEKRGGEVTQVVLSHRGGR
ncbi:hypothetical protein CBR_g44552 [Chara braunii]|uniref:Uncharacterized protein n=1 Tax=Chara braunii TaxID=69332 RepID=A0A388LXQ8_CHABU|nr:hypothetical protein CBR_g44552 [Chara braunii]|eukprot:GBG87096.1 hypothetical protein CBR_g44552 [Chara braunii]